MEIIEGAEAEAIRRMPDESQVGVHAALRAGKVVWAPSKTAVNLIQVKADMRRFAGFRMTIRDAERAGVKGTYAWVDKEEELG